MKVGRNDPCPCGSGKKYKKCCLAADEAKMPAIVEPPSANREAEPPAAPVAPPPPRPVDPRQAAINQALDERYKQFEAAELEGKAAMFLSLVEGEGDPPMDEEDVFEMLNALYAPLARSNQRDRFDDLIEALRQKQPRLYEEAKGNCLEWIIGNRLAQGRWDDLAGLVNELAALAGKDIDRFQRVLDMLDFHGRLPLLLEASGIAWPQVKESDDIMSWAIDEFARRASLYEIYDYLEQHPAASGQDEELLARLRPYIEEEISWVAPYVTLLTSPVPAAAPLNLADFDLKRRKPKRRHRDEYDDEEAPTVEQEESGPERSLVELSVRFLGWMRRTKNVALTRGEVGRREMVQFLFDRVEGKLDDHRSIMDRMMQPDRKLPKRPIEHPLCPDRIRFEAYLTRLLGMMNLRYHDAAALIHVAPLWLEFLELNGLLTAAQREKAKGALGGLREPIREVFSSDVDVPDLKEVLSTWD